MLPQHNSLASSYQLKIYLCMPEEIPVLKLLKQFCYWRVQIHRIFFLPCCCLPLFASFISSWRSTTISSKTKPSQCNSEDLVSKKFKQDQEKWINCFKVDLEILKLLIDTLFQLQTLLVFQSDGMALVDLSNSIKLTLWIWKPKDKICSGFSTHRSSLFCKHP